MPVRPSHTALHISATLLPSAQIAPMPVTATTPCWHHILISNIRATCYWEAGMILGLPEKPIDGLVLADLDIDAPHGLRISYATNVAFHHVDIRVKAGDPITIYDTVTNVAR